MASDDLMRAVAADMGWDADDYLAFTVSVQAEARYQAATKAAHERGVFGVPTMIIGEEMWWGNDRLDFVEEYLAGGSGA